jgi:CheY-like chemotaxis protein
MSESDPSQPRLLVCDDSTIERQALALFLRENGYAVDEANDGNAAIVHLKLKAVDIILLDLNMPGSDGFAVLSYLQENKPALPVILLSGMAVNTIQHKMHGLPTPELPPLLLKPIDPQQLLGLLDLQLSHQFPPSAAAEKPHSPGQSQ